MFSGLLEEFLNFTKYKINTAILHLVLSVIFFLFFSQTTSLIASSKFQEVANMSTEVYWWLKGLRKSHQNDNLSNAALCVNSIFI